MNPRLSKAVSSLPILQKNSTCILQSPQILNIWAAYCNHISGEHEFYLKSQIRDAAIELLQDVILKALEIQDRYPGNDVQAWLLGIAGNLLKQKKQRVINSRETAVSNLPDTQQLEENETAFFDQFASMAMNDPNQHFAIRDQLQVCLATLSIEDQRILLLHIEYGMNLHEVAGKLAINHAAARARFKRALDRLRKVWNAQENGKGGASNA